MQKLDHLGVGLQECYCLIAVVGLYKKLFLKGSASINAERDAAERVATIMQKMLAQQDDYSAAATLASLPTTVSPILMMAQEMLMMRLADAIAEWQQSWSSNG